MPEKEPQFTVTDRRKFALDGSLRDEEASSPETSSSESAPPTPAPPAITPATEDLSASPASSTNDASAEPEEDGPADPSDEESAQQRMEYDASSRRLDETLRKQDPSLAGMTPMSFDRLVQSIYMTAAVQMGAGTAPNEQPRIDILGARQSIDMLAVLEEKTRGNLIDDEKRLLQNALFDLRMSFLEITKAIASSAQRASKPSPGHN